MKKIFFLVLLFSCFMPPIYAQITVVRVDKNRVFLDTSEQKTAPIKGSTFKVILSSETLTNPKTGKNLGEVYTYSEPGTLIEVQPLYAIGEMKNTTGVTIGKQVVLEEKQDLSTPPTKPTEQPLSTRKKIVYQPIEQTIISLTEADITSPGAKNIITLSDQNEITVFVRMGQERLEPLMHFTLPSGKKGLSISAGSVKEGLAQIFVTTFTDSNNTFQTDVLENKEGTLQHTSTLPLFVKELGCGDTKKLWGQRPFVSESAPGNARLIVMQKGKFSTGKETFNTRRHWLQGLNYFPVENSTQENLISTNNNGILRLFLANGKQAESKDVFGSTPLRVTYKREILKFYPSLQVFGKPGEATLAAVENDAKYGLLSKTFGKYQSGKIHFLNYQKGRLQTTDTVVLDGVVYDTACTQTSILTAEVLADGTSAIVEILK